MRIISREWMDKKGMKVEKKREKVKHDRVYTCLYSCTGHMGGGEDRKEGDKREKKRQKEI